MGLPRSVRPTAPVFPDAYRDEARAGLMSRGVFGAVLLIADGTVLYRDSNRLSRAEFMDFLRRIAENLICSGIRVFTNAASPNSEIVRGTCALRLSIPELTAAAEVFRAIISVPTGLAELLSLTDCMLINVFPEEYAFSAAHFDEYAGNEKVLSFIWNVKNSEALANEVVRQVIGERPHDERSE
jgi:hypothetical protein